MITCPVCGGPTGSRETRTVSNYVRRRRACLNTNCGERVTTVEVIVDSTRQLNDAVVVPQRDLERMLKLVGAPLVAKFGAIAVSQMLEEVEPPQPVTPKPDPEK